MLKSLLVILVYLLSASSAQAHVENDVERLLRAKDFLAFRKHVANLSSGVEWITLRDLTPEVQEGVVIIERTVPDKINASISTVYTFRVNLIATKTTILYYQLSQQLTRTASEGWETYDKPIATFRDEKSFNALQTAFRSAFHAELNEQELFITDFQYGSHCGFGGTNPPGRDQVNKWVASGNKTGLLKWLKSTNTEKQVYAVDGLLQLKKKGSALKDEELRMIRLIVNKSGTMNVCSGCLQSTDEIKDVTKAFRI